MTHLLSDGGAPLPPSSMPGRQVLDLKILLRRARLSDLEIAMSAACEAAALGEPRTSATDRESWDRATWHRYLAAAMRLESTYAPRMRRIRQEIGQLERLMTLLTAT
jgi:hypothetical protein